MGNNKDNEARALLDAMCEFLVSDLHYMPVAATMLRGRFEAQLSGGARPRGGAIAADRKGVPTERPLSEQ